LSGLLGQFLLPGPDLKEVRRFDEAITACQDAAAIYRDTGDHHGEGAALGNLGLALHQVRRGVVPWLGESAGSLMVWLGSSLVP